jgi:hypothetical protein
VRRLLLIALPALLALSLTLAACGDDDDEGTTAAETITTDATTETAEADATGPSGLLTQTGVGLVQRGTTVDEATELFGPPAEELTAPGCELAGPEAPEVRILTYELGDGELNLTFNADTGELESYRSTTPDLETERGDTVDEPFTSVKANWGAELKFLPIGTAKPTGASGLWVVGKTGSQLLFDVRGGEVASISGGSIQICE